MQNSIYFYYIQHYLLVWAINFLLPFLNILSILSVDTEQQKYLPFDKNSTQKMLVETIHY